MSRKHNRPGKVNTVSKRETAGFPYRERAAIGVTGAITAVLQILLVREVFTTVAGNELVIGLMFAVWLAATAAGSAVTLKRTPFSLQNALVILVISFAVGMIATRAVRLVLLPGAALPPHVLPLLMIAVEAPGAATGGYIFGLLAGRGGGVRLYAREQAGTLVGLGLVALGVGKAVPNFTIAAVLFCFVLPVLRGVVRKSVVLVAVIAFFLADNVTVGWKYPLPVAQIGYTPEGETAKIPLDGDTITYVNGRLYSVTYATTAVEQAVHAPLSMLPEAPHRVLLINDAGERDELHKYHSVTIDCIRLDRLIDNDGCPPGKLRQLSAEPPYDAVILGCPLPDNAADSRYFTRSFLRNIRTLTGKTGVFSFTLPFQAEYRDEREETMRSILLNTLRSVFRNVKVLPGEGFSFLASDTEYRLPESCRVTTNYFAPMVLTALTPERLAAANRPPSDAGLHTVSRPRLLVPVLDGYLRLFSLSRWMFIAVPLVLVALLLTVVRGTKEAVSVGTTGMCAGIYSTGITLMYQSVYGTVYSQLPLLLLALSIGLVVGCFVRRFPFSDLTAGGVLGGTLLLLLVLQVPPAPLFFLCNALAGVVSSAQFVTRTTGKTGLLYAADCTGGVLGMALASTVFIPLFGMGTVAAGITVVKIGSAIYQRTSGKT